MAGRHLHSALSHLHLIVHVGLLLEVVEDGIGMNAGDAIGVLQANVETYRELQGLP